MKWMRYTAASLSALGLVMCLNGCSRLKPQAPSSYAVDTQTAWHTIELTTDGMHYGVDAQGVSSNGPIRTVWLQKRSANSPYLYDQWQISVHCADRQWIWLLRTVVDGILLKKPQTPVWLSIKAGSKEEKVMQKVCVNRR